MLQSTLLYPTGQVGVVDGLVTRADARVARIALRKPDALR